MLTRRGLNARAVLASSREILHVGLPAAATRMVMPVGLGVLTRIVAGFGPASVAAFGVGSRVGMFSFAVIMALGASLVPFVGQNLGAGRRDRVRAAAWFSIRFGTGYGVVTWVLFLVLARPIAGIFHDHPEFLDATTLYFRIVPVGMIFAAATAMASTALNGMLMPLRAALLSVVQMFVLAVPLSWLGARLGGLAGMFWGGVAANVAAGILAIFVLKRALEKSGAAAPAAPRSSA
jgi:Na+-driven multidrug efflux pump